MLFNIDNPRISNLMHLKLKTVLSRNIYKMKYLSPCLLQGMHYIHGSSIGVHGRLSSSTCVIDSRFVLKVTGFGLQTISAFIEETDGIYHLQNAKYIY